jgi:hypothetical protein
MRQLGRAALCLIVVLSLGATLVEPFRLLAPVPMQLTDQQFWSLSREWSEDDGVFRSDNLLSNETTFQYVIPGLLKASKQGRVYMGVGRSRISRTSLRSNPQWL